jgi:hypothetical protein
MLMNVRIILANVGRTNLRISTEGLSRAESVSKILSSIAIPIVLAVVGYYVQRQIADEGLKKDYVAIAAGILKDSPKAQDAALRNWAVQMLDSNSPIRFTPEAKASLRNAPLPFERYPLPSEILKGPKQ